MKWKKFNLIYANGSSLSAGGGLEHDTVLQEYKKLHGVKWVNEKEVTYPKLIADHFGVDLVHDAQSGSGAPRLIRRTYEFIEKYGLDVAKNTLFILEFTDPLHRIDFWCEKIQDYVIVNVRYDGNNKIQSLNIHERISKSDRKYDPEYFDYMKADVYNYLNKYHNPYVYNFSFAKQIISLFTFFEYNDIDYFFSFDNNLLETYSKIIGKLEPKRFLNIEGHSTISKFCDVNKLTIRDELNGFTGDSHPGYFGNKVYAEKAIELIKDRLRPKIYCFGDSFTQTFQGHMDAKSEWFMKYYDYKNYVPKNYIDLLQEYFDCEVVNLGFGGCSNDKIYQSFVSNLHQIKENDILIFGWSSISRFQLASELNDFVEVTAFAGHPSPNNDVSVKTIEEIATNRGTYDVYWGNIRQNINAIKKMYPKNTIYHWSWVEPTTYIPEKFWSGKIAEENYAITFIYWKEADDKIKEKISKEADYVFDLTHSEPDFDLYDKLKKQNKKLLFINPHEWDYDVQQEYNKRMRHLWFQNENHQKRCYDLMLPFVKHETIFEETNGLVNDKHYSEKGHRDLANMIIDDYETNNTYKIRKNDLARISKFENEHGRNGLLDKVSSDVIEVIRASKLI